MSRRPALRPAGAIESRDTQITLICTVAGPSELERYPVQSGGSACVPVQGHYDGA